MEQPFICPYCWQQTSLVLDVSEDGPQAYVEDCEVCSRPLAVAFEVVDGEVEDLMVDTVDG
ncbi:MAG: CPXCG motif-containing cysteine-rich protein [Bacteroidetes bacterium]|nr:CPXCG motif-containing cysteine-rich protein [Bacteroidota bacterium]